MSEYPTSEHLIAERRDGVLHLRLNRPDRRNALNTALLADLAAALAEAADDARVRAACLTGAGGHFAAGAVIDEIAQMGAAEGAADPRKASWAAIRAFPKPLVAGVDGYCLGGGCELMLMADLAVAGRDAKFGLPETNLGIIPGAGGAQRLTALIGRARAMRMVLTGEIVDAAMAADWGLVAWRVEGAAADEAAALADKLARRAPLALAAAKRAVIDAAEGPLAESLAAERRAFEALLDTADKAEGIAAFRDKRKPAFEGR